ncbi:ATP synthase F1 subunit epsilon [Mycoplasma leonicaptivi]|uniref:ATP synthase F1 subunit epsilon n=1 Tax=Mycoplasma leonicaptivi TaxID=36742 RepID=UPI0004828074|nr:ATP synthase F1 subunit epsilon [Mycoplasma leonicaptivi]
MLTKNTTHLKITVPNGIFYEGDVEIVTLKTPSGYIGIQKGRSPLFSSIEIGVLTIGHSTDDNHIKCYIGGGLVYVEKDKVNIITDDIINIDNIDISRAQKDKENIEMVLSNNKDTIDILKLETKLKKTLYRIQSYNLYKKQ